MQSCQLVSIENRTAPKGAARSHHNDEPGRAAPNLFGWYVEKRFGHAHVVPELIRVLGKDLGEQRLTLFTLYEDHVDALGRPLVADSRQPVERRSQRPVNHQEGFEDAITPYGMVMTSHSI
jgi:hypothetical protein